MKRLHVGAVALFCLLLLGCGGNRHPVRGKVVYPDGTPVTAGMVVCELIVEGESPRVSANGAIQPDGSFQLGTLRPEDGVPAGRYRVAVVSPPLSDEQAGKGEKPLVDGQFADHAKSGLEIEVTAGANEVTLKVTRPATAAGKSR
jgi:hypothetical protein